MRTHIRITPCDTCFFRDGKPFTSGEQTEAATIFPPFPSTVFGALRGAFIAEKGWDAFLHGELDQTIGTQEHYNNASLHLKGVFLQNQHGTLYFTMPYDLVVDEKEWKHDPQTTHALALSRSDAVSGNSPLPSVLMNMDRPDITVEYPPDGAYIRRRHLRRYLCGDHDRISPVGPKQFFDREPKTGIARHASTMTAKDGHLYQMNMIRLKQGTGDRYHFLADVEGLTFSTPNGMLKLGGEQKAFSYSQTAGQPVLAYNETEKQLITESIRKANGEFKLYFATPALWDNADGWRAKWMNLGDDRHVYTDPQTGKSVICQLLTAASGKYQLIGGWEIRKHRPKTMYRAVPAGTVYYLKLLEGEPEDMLELLHDHNLSDIRAQEGFGLAYVGIV